ncbi:unnamed protein product [Cuscuta campestris]|uniref:CCHC-type domain-containing protein n=1 Tax=Cuscuta campestris TaxID=132261 RepID=A0A484L688_9ASTE|nr:unnamed protein product [Cuscuta campestris]
MKVKVQRIEKMTDAEWAKHRKNDKPEKLSEEEWEDLKDMATSTICLCLANNTLREVLGLTDPVDIWDKLESRYKSKSLTSRLYLKKRLFGLQMAEEANFNGHLDEFNKITTELESIDVKIEEEDKALLLLASLPSSFDNIVTTLLFGKETLKFDEVVAALLMNETRRGGNGVSNDGQALVAKGAGRERRRSKERGDASQRFKSSSKSFRCYYCDEEGHFKRDCPKRRKEKKDGKTPVTAVAESSNQASEEDLFLATTKSLGKSDWILDSGCSFHMCSIKEQFDTYQTCDGGAVKMANGARSKIAGVGTVQVRMFDGVVRTLTGVKHWPVVSFVSSDRSMSSHQVYGHALPFGGERVQIAPPWSGSRYLPPFWVPPGQLTANAHKYVASYILRCCALDRTPMLDEFLVLFSIGGAFPYYSLFPHPQSPIFERVESKNDKWARRYFVIEFPVHSPIDLPGVVRRSSISRTLFAAIPLAEAAYNALRGKGGLISHHSLQDARLYKKADFYYPLGPDPIPFEGVSSPERSKAPPVVESNPSESSSRNQAQGNTTALAICKPTAALDVVPISAIPGLRKPTPSQKRPREGVTDDDFLPKKSKGDGTPASPIPLTASSSTQNTTPAAASGGLELPNLDSLDHEIDELPDQTPLKRPIVQPQPAADNTSPPTAATSQGVEEEAEGQKETEASPDTERETGKPQEPEEQRSAAAPPAFSLPIRRKFTPQTYPVFKEGWAGFSRGLRSLQASHWTIQANLEKMRESVQEPTTPQARPDLLALNALHSMEQRMRKARLGRSFPPAEAELLRESRTASPNLPKSPNDGSSVGAPAPQPGAWEDYDMDEADDSAACPSSKRRSPWRGPPPPSS